MPLITKDLLYRIIIICYIIYISDTLIKSNCFEYKDIKKILSNLKLLTYKLNKKI